MKLQYSAISRHSMVKGTPKFIREWLMSLQEDSRASHFRFQGKEEKNWMIEICGLKLLRRLAQYDQDSHYWRMSPALLPLNILEPFLQIFPQLGTIVDGQLWEGIMLEHRMRGKDYGFLPTLVSSEAEMFQNGNIRKVETWDSTTHLSHYLIGMELNLKN